MRRKVEPLLCELHAHTRWSDGALTLPELVDLYGTNGFDVLAVTDHVVRGAPDALAFGVHGGNHADYLAEIAAQAERARRDYDLLVVPGIELTYDDPNPFASAHTVAVGIRDLVSLDEGIEPALARARDAGAALIAPIRTVTVTPTSGPTVPRSASRATGANWLRSSTGGSCSTAASCSRGSRSTDCRRSRAATSTSRSTSSAGRRFCPAPNERTRWSTTSARRAPRSSRGSTTCNSCARPDHQEYLSSQCSL